VWARGFHHKWVKTALYFFGFQLLYNATWSMVFFGLRRPFAAFIILVVLFVLILLTYRQFRVVSRTAAYLLIPYLLWVVFAGVLNFEIVRLN
jgi:tryptophan-rich sensory protein